MPESGESPDTAWRPSAAAPAFLWRASSARRRPVPRVVYLPGLGPHSTGRTRGQRLLQRFEVLGLARTFEVWLVGRRGLLQPGTTIADLAEQHAAAIRARFDAPVDVVGESTGGSIALRLAIDHPDVVRRLVLVSAAGRLRRRGEQAQAHAAQRITEGHPRRAAATILAHTNERPVLRHLLRLAGLVLGRLAIGRDDRELVLTIRAEDGFDVEGDLSAVQAPTLLIGGGSDGYAAPQLLERAAAGIPDAVHVDLPRRGHLSAMFDGTVRAAVRAHLRGEAQRRPVPSGPVAERFEYGDGAMQYGVFHPAAGPLRGTVVLIHGGFWRGTPGYFDGPTPLAGALVDRGWNVWQIEYRQLPNGGGWPGTLDDVAAAIEHLRVVASSLGVDLGPVIPVGHSAGGHLAVWALSRPDALLPLSGAVSLAGVLDLGLGEAERIGSGAVPGFLGGSSAEHPERYAAADPIRRIEPRLPVRIVHGSSDDVVPMNQSDSYAAAAGDAGQDVTVAVVEGDHMVVIDPEHPAFEALLHALEQIRDADPRL